MKKRKISLGETGRSFHRLEYALAVLVCMGKSNNPVDELFLARAWWDEQGRDLPVQLKPANLLRAPIGYVTTEILFDVLSGRPPKAIGQADAL